MPKNFRHREILILKEILLVPIGIIFDLKISPHINKHANIHIEYTLNDVSAYSLDIIYLIFVINIQYFSNKLNFE